MEMKSMTVSHQKALHYAIVNFWNWYMPIIKDTLCARLMIEINLNFSWFHSKAFNFNFKGMNQFCHNFMTICKWCAYLLRPFQQLNCSLIYAYYFYYFSVLFLFLFCFVFLIYNQNTDQGGVGRVEKKYVRSVPAAARTRDFTPPSMFSTSKPVRGFSWVFLKWVALDYIFT